MYHSCMESKQKSSSIAKISTTTPSREYTTSASSHSTKNLTSTSNHVIDDRFIDDALHPYILQANIQRRQKCPLDKEFNSMATEIIISQLNGVVMTRYHGVGFHPWIEEDQTKLSKVIGRIWKDIAQRQHTKAVDNSNAIAIVSTKYKARKVLSISKFKVQDTNTTVDLRQIIRIQVQSNIKTQGCCCIPL